MPVTHLFAWLRAHDALLWWLGALSLVSFIGTLVVIPMLVVRLPADYFMRDRPTWQTSQRSHPTLRLLGVILKNLLGVVCIIAGLIMLVLPGQGVLTILIGLTLMNFPGKHTMELRIVQQPTVLHAINWMRLKAQRPPLEVPAYDGTPRAPQ
jgi:hypothetical protein